MNNRAKVGGILSIVAGSFGILSLFIFIFMAYFFQTIITSTDSNVLATPEEQAAFNMMSNIYIGVGATYATLGIFAVVSGVLALRRIYWGLALAGAISATMTFFPCGIAAVILVAMGKPEFDSEATPVVEPTLVSPSPVISSSPPDAS